MTAVLMLAKAGYFGSNPVEIYKSPVNIVMNIYHYETFLREYESTYYELNKGK